MLTFVARPYLIPSESMEPTLHGCTGCVGDRIMVDKLTYRFTEPEPGDVVVFKGPPKWNIGYKSIRSDNTAVRWVQNALSFVGFVPPDENDLVKRVIAVGGQTVECRADHRADRRRQAPRRAVSRTRSTMMADPADLPLPGQRVRAGDGARGPAVGDGRQPHPFRRFPGALHAIMPADAQRGLLCTGDPTAGTVPVDNVIGKARFIAWPPSRWGGWCGPADVNPQQRSSSLRELRG